MIYLTLKHLKTTTWCGPQGADSHSESRPERPGTKTSWYFCIKNVVQRYKNYHIDRKYSSPCLFIVITTTASIVTVEMFNIDVHVDRIWLHCSGSFRIVPDFSTSHPSGPLAAQVVLKTSTRSLQHVHQPAKMATLMKQDGALAVSHKQSIFACGECNTNVKQVCSLLVIIEKEMTPTRSVKIGG